MDSEEEVENVFDRLDVEVVTIMRIRNDDGSFTLDINHDGVDDDIAMALIAKAMVAMGQLEIEEPEDEE